MNTKNSKKLEKSRGIVAFAFNTDATDYVKIANRTLKFASQTLNLPYHLITETNLNQGNNTRYDIDTNSFVEWKNLNRASVYDLTPYDETLVIDVDLLVLDRSILQIFDCKWDYLLQSNSHALTTVWPENMGPHGIPYVWATVFAFRKNERSKLFFDLVTRVQNNYGYYRLLYNIQERNYRNDYAFAIADNILNGYKMTATSIPGSLLAINDPIESLETYSNNYIVARDQHRAYMLPKTNIHIMSKRYLLSDNFENFLNTYAA